ncbi:hypothetical protein C1646_761564 [Rhizophagus diaphanus]|nr:hypothetical protein C1646_761564 [Rhizophagus diaphanus] [Rhizophagus sp. MUCL 43196]
MGLISLAGNFACENLRSHDSDEDHVQLESELKETSKRKDKKKSNNEAHIGSSYESLENFIPFQHEYSLHEANVNLSNKDLELDIQPYFIFLMKTIVDNTNIYAYAHGVKVGKGNLAAVEDYWKMDMYYSSYEVTKLMSLFRF